MGGGVVKSKMIFLAPQILSLPVLQKLRSVYFVFTYSKIQWYCIEDIGGSKLVYFAFG